MRCTEKRNDLMEDNPVPAHDKWSFKTKRERCENHRGGVLQHHLQFRLCTEIAESRYE